MTNSFIKEPIIITTMFVILLAGLGSIYYILTKKYIFHNHKYDPNSEEYLYLGSKKIRIRVVNRIVLILFSLPLIVYPFVMLANLMQIVALPIVGFDIAIVVPLPFIVSTTSYPLAIVLCWTQNTKKHNTHIWLSVIPLIHVGLIFLTFIYWSKMEPFLTMK